MKRGGGAGEDVEAAASRRPANTSSAILLLFAFLSDCFGREVVVSCATVATLGLVLPLPPTWTKKLWEVSSAPLSTSLVQFLRGLIVGGGREGEGQRKREKGKWSSLWPE